MQAVCHSIITIFAPSTSPSINTQSGLFVRRCTDCGLELKLGPLHTLVVTAFYLAQLGMQGETLFGALSIMVCLIALGADVSMKANISVEDILRSSDTGQCRHTLLSPLELMQAVPGGVIEAWSENCQIGWSCLIQILELAIEEEHQESRGSSQGRWTSPPKDEWPETPVSSSSVSSNGHFCDPEFQEEFHDNWVELPCIGPRMGLLWASVQTELLTYRRLREGDSWISENFSMVALKNWLQGGSREFSTPLVQNRMLQRHTRCGWFNGAGNNFLLPVAQEVCSEYFMNMDIHGRASYIGRTYLFSFIDA